jgi:cytochrome c2
MACFRPFPPGTAVYAFSTFRSPEPGPMAVAIFWAIVAAFALLAFLIHRRRDPVQRSREASGTARLLAGAAAAALVLAGSYGPYGLFRVVPFASPADVEAVAGVEWHETPAVQAISVAPADAFEAQVEAETFKWCTFCHNMQPGGEQHKVGPNLYNILGQKAGTVPGFGYSDAMKRAREDGLLWTEANIAAYVANPQAFMPGTSMIISSGPIPDPAVQAAVVNILKRQTRPFHIE